MRQIAVGAFAQCHVRPAAELLAAHCPSIVEFSDSATARRFIDSWRGRCPAVAAVRDGELVGFLAAKLPKTPGEPLAKIQPEHHCAIPDGRRDIYRAMYGALSGRLVGVGAFHHMITVATTAADVVQDFVELEFGIDQIKGRRPPTRLPESPLAVRPARADDVAALTDLAAEVTRFHAEPPMLRPALVDLAAIRAAFESALDRDRELLLVAEHNGRPAGMMHAVPDTRYRNTATIGLAGVTPSVRTRGIGTALLAGIMDWVADRGFAACDVEWTSANPVSDRFWRGHGFEPVHYKLIRRIDPQVAWADPGLSYEHFRP